MKNFIFFPFFFMFSVNSQQQIINTPQGRVHGFTRDTDYGKVRVFMGVPFAQPPVGNLRLKPPQPAPKFTGDYNATYNRPSCLQNSIYLPPNMAKLVPWLKMDLSEDCLYLNIYTPEKTQHLFPVMVWIHGGGYFTGTGSMYDPKTLVAKGKVVVVTINYRLGLLGFFPGGGPENTLGLRDQIEALKWVKDNIRSYGGDPNQVTIFGESAGSQSVSYLSMSPKAEGLFKRAISQSGVALSSFYKPLDVKPSLEKLLVKGKELGCKASNALDCAKQIPAANWTQFSSSVLYTYPDVDNDVIMADFGTNFSRIHKNLAIIIGLNTNDGGLSVFIICSSMMTKTCLPYRGVTQEEFFNTVSFLPIDKQQQEILLNTYSNWYPYKAPKRKTSLLAAAELSTDIQYRLTTNKTATNAAKNGNKILVYELNSKPKSFPVPWASTWTDDADHGDDVAFLFSWLDKKDANYEISLNMIDMWTNFAKGSMPEHWPTFTTNKAEYLLINDQNPGGATRKPLIQEQKNSFWLQYEATGRFPDTWATAGSQGIVVNVNLVVVFIYSIILCLR